MKENILSTFSSRLDYNKNTIVKLYKNYEFTTEPKHIAPDTFEFRILNVKGDFQIQTIKYDGGIAPFNKETMKFGPMRFLYDTHVTFEILINIEFNKISQTRLFYLKEFDYFEEFINLSNELTFKYLVMKYFNTYQLLVKNPLKIRINGKNEDFVFKSKEADINISLSFIIEHETLEKQWQIVADYDINEASERKNNIFEQSKKEEVTNNIFAATDTETENLASERKNNIFKQSKKEEVTNNIFAATDTETENLAKYLVEKPKTRTISVATDDDLVSAVEKMEQKSKAKLDDLPNALFYEALSRNENVKVRKPRTQLCGCKTEEEFLAKVYCLRKAFDKILKNEQTKQRFIQYGQNIFAGLILKNNENPKDFLIAYEKLMIAHKRLKMNAYFLRKLC
uniref:Uncharacterized protein n=1 Tax=Panagrolaimus sp. PS1159 TaxID=55785 RepID=A0AC35F9E4_9BILA